MSDQRFIAKTVALACAIALSCASATAFADHHDKDSEDTSSQDTLSKDLEQFEQSHGDLDETAKSGTGSAAPPDNATTRPAGQQSEQVEALSRDVDEYYKNAGSPMDGHRVSGEADPSSAPAHASEKSKAISKDLDAHYNYKD